MISRGSTPASNQSAMCGSTRSPAKARTVSRMSRSSSVSWSSICSRSVLGAPVDMAGPLCSLQIRVLTGEFRMSARPRSGHDLAMNEPSSNGTKRLYRPRDGRVVAGVCAGLAAYFGVDPTLVRLAFALLTSIRRDRRPALPVRLDRDPRRGRRRRLHRRDLRQQAALLGTGLELAVYASVCCAWISLPRRCVQLMASMVAAVRPSRPARPTASGAPIACANRAAGQDAEPLNGVQAGLGHAERAGSGGRTQRLHERRGRGQLVGAARARQRPQRQDGPQRRAPRAADERGAGKDGEPAHHPDPRGRRRRPCRAGRRRSPCRAARPPSAVPRSPCCRAANARTARPGPPGRCKSRPASRKAAGSAAGGCRRRSGCRPPRRTTGKAGPFRRAPALAGPLTPIRTMRADMPNVAASMPSVRCGSRTATTAAPATKPRIWLAW